MMKLFKVSLTIRKMGFSCHGCRQVFICTVEANDKEEAVSEAKILSGADQSLYKFNINSIQEVL